MRIISGEARGRRLFAPEGMDTRPTTDRVRESLFGILSSRIFDARVLDLFAGSGALGLEAVSRGARSAVLCDKSPKAIRVIERNIQATGFGQKVSLVRGQWAMALRQFAGSRFDIVFLDPPYRELQLYTQAMAALQAGGMLAEDAVLVVEHLAKQPPEFPQGFEVYDRRSYGDTVIDLVREEEKDGAGDLSGQL